MRGIATRTHRPFYETRDLGTAYDIENQMAVGLLSSDLQTTHVSAESAMIAKGSMVRWWRCRVNEEV